MPVKVLIVEDNPVARSFLSRVVRESFSDLMEMAFSKRESVGWLAKLSSSGDRPARSLKTGSARSVSWLFWSS